MHDQSVEVAGVGEGAAHDLCVGDALGAVSKRDGSGRLEQADLRHFLAFEAFGDRGHRMNVDDARIARAPKDVVDGCRIIDCRRRIRLADNRRDTTGCGRVAGRSERFAAGFAWLADEGAHVDQAGGDELAAAVDDVGAFRHAGSADAFLRLAHHAVGDQQIADNIEIARRIDDPGVGEQDRAAVG